MLVLSDVTKKYRGSAGEVCALNGVSLTVSDGEYLSIVGQSGSGKSTLMHILGCLDLPTSGSVCLDGRELTELSPRERAILRNREIGFVFQSFNLLAACTALENVELPLGFRGIPMRRRREMAQEALCAVGLAERMNHRPGELSGGQQQRVAVARAIAASPRLILADEPTGNLDRDSTDRVLSLLKALNADGRTLILITHDERVAERASRRAALQSGRLYEDQYPNTPVSESSFSIHSR